MKRFRLFSLVLLVAAVVFVSSRDTVQAHMWCEGDGYEGGFDAGCDGYMCGDCYCLCYEAMGHEQCDPPVDCDSWCSGEYPALPGEPPVYCRGDFSCDVGGYYSSCDYSCTCQIVVG